MATKKTSVLNIKLVKSTISCKKDQIATVESLGLHKVGETVQQPKNDATMGKIKKVIHLVEVTEA